MKILIGVIVALVLLLGVGAWRLSAAQEANGQMAVQLGDARNALADANAQNTKLNDRFDSLDASLKGLGAKQQQNQTELKARIAGISKLTQESTDDPRTIVCAGLPVPAQLDRGLREPATNR